MGIRAGPSDDPEAIPVEGDAPGLGIYRRSGGGVICLDVQDVALDPPQGVRAVGEVDDGVASARWGGKDTAPRAGLEMRVAGGKPDHAAQGSARGEERGGSSPDPRQARERRMEDLLQALGTVTMVLLVGIGLLAGWIAGVIAGRRMLLYMAVGVVAAVAAPFIVAALGLGVLAAGSLLAILAVAFVGAVIVLAIVKAVFD